MNHTYCISLISSTATELCPGAILLLFDQSRSREVSSSVYRAILSCLTSRLICSPPVPRIYRRTSSRSSEQKPCEFLRPTKPQPHINMKFNVIKIASRQFCLPLATRRHGATIRERHGVVTESATNSRTTDPVAELDWIRV